MDWLGEIPRKSWWAGRVGKNKFTNKIRLATYWLVIILIKFKFNKLIPILSNYV